MPVRPRVAVQTARRGRCRPTDGRVGGIVYTAHAILQMFARSISAEQVESVLAEGVVIDDQPDDVPWPSCLLLGWSGTLPVHVVKAFDSATETTFVVTAYIPDRALWNREFTKRRRT